MNQEQLLRAMQDVDPALLERSERKKKRYWPVVAAAACLCLALGLTALHLGRPQDGVDVDTVPSALPGTQLAESEPPESSEAPDQIPVENVTLYYNPADLMNADGALAQWLCIFGEVLTEQECSAALPEGFPASLEVSGSASYLGGGELLWLSLEITDPAWGGSASVQIREENQIEPPRCAILPEENIVATVLNGTSVTAYEHANDFDLFIGAEFDRDGLNYRLDISAEPGQEAAAKAMLQQLTELYTAAEAVPDLSLYVPKEEYEFINEELTLNAALADAHFGGYMLRNVPAGFTEESVSRYKAQHLDQLVGLWTRGYDNLRWTVSYLTDEGRIVDVNCPEQYDMSLYPIPLAESVPEELREIVDNPIFRIEDLTLELVYARAYTVQDAGDSSGYRMRFSVLYGDTVVEISAKGVSPEWIYEQLKGMQ